jgi:hypothetical protein
MLRLAASLADQAPVSPGDAITGIDDRNVGLLVKAVLLRTAPAPLIAPAGTAPAVTGCPDPRPDRREFATVGYATLPVGDPGTT